MLIWSLLAVSLGAIWFLALARFLAITSLILVAAILFCFVGQGLEVRQTTKAEDFRTFAESQGVKVDKVPDWIIGKYRRYEHLHSQEWLQTGIAALGLSFFVWVGLRAVRPRKRQPTDSDGSPQATS